MTTSTWIDPATRRLLACTYTEARDKGLPQQLAFLVDQLSARSFLYAIASVERVKFGRSSNPIARLRSLQTGSAWPLRLLGVVPEYVYSERDAHDRYQDLRLDGEWFSHTPSIDEWVLGWVDAESRKQLMVDRLHGLILINRQSHRPLEQLDATERRTLVQVARAQARAEKELTRQMKEAKRSAALERGCMRCKGVLADRTWESGVCAPCVRAEDPTRLQQAETEYRKARQRLSTALWDLAIIRARHRLAAVA